MVQLLINMMGGGEKVCIIYPYRYQLPFSCCSLFFYWTENSQDIFWDYLPSFIIKISRTSIFSQDNVLKILAIILKTSAFVKPLILAFMLLYYATKFILDEKILWLLVQSHSKQAARIFEAIKTYLLFYDKKLVWTRLYTIGQRPWHLQITSCQGLNSTYHSPQKICSYFNLWNPRMCTYLQKGALQMCLQRISKWDHCGLYGWVFYPVTSVLIRNTQRRLGRKRRER